MPPSLSKSSFLRGSQCTKSLYLHWYHPELRDEISPMQRAIFGQGNVIGKLAQQLFPDGVDAGIYVPDNYGKSIEMTSHLIESGAKVIYEAGFSHQNLHCFVDILVRNGDEWTAYEVKSATQVKPVNILDAAFQYFVMTANGLNLRDFHLVVLNPNYERVGDLDILQLFRSESVLSRLLRLQDRVKNDTAKFLAMLERPSEPVIDIGPHCADPHDCDFRGHCWRHVPEYSIFDIAGLDGNKKWDLYNKGILELKDIPPGYPLSVRQWQQVRQELSGVEHLDIDSVREFVKNLEYPLHFLDFESFQPAAPLFDHSRTYQQIVFQYSLHILPEPGAILLHKEFLASVSEDPRMPFIESLVKDIGEAGDILVFNQAFEATRLREIADCYPEFHEKIEGVLIRVKDLMNPFRQRHYYTPAMRGSFSIKQVYPALVPGKGYTELPISDGGSASLAFASLIKESDNENIMEIRKNLLAYCKLDTLAMVSILEKLESLVD